MNVFPDIVTRLYLYQKARFPVVMLLISFLPAILSSGAVAAGEVQVSFVVLSLVASLAYLFHVRIIDEGRDFFHDSIHHKDRPLSQGVITLAALRRIDAFALIILAVCALYATWHASLLVVVMLVYSYLASKEFYVGTFLRKHFFLYNTLNLVQMLLLQLLVYVFALGMPGVSEALVLHFLFTTCGTVAFEFLRKVYVPGNDGTGKDTYTSFLGFKGTLGVYAVIVALVVLFYVQLTLSLNHYVVYWIPLLVLLILNVCGTILANLYFKSERSNQIMQLGFLLLYGGCNILIFLGIIL